LKQLSRDQLNLEESQKLYFSLQKYPWVYPVIMMLLSFLDSGVLLLYYKWQYLEGRAVLPQLLAAHVVVFIIVIIFRRSSSPQTREISPLMFLILPGVGSLLFSLSYLVLYFVGSRFVKKELRHSYMDEEVKYEKEVSIDFKQIGRLMDMAGVFSYSDSSHKKDMIVDLLSGDITANSKLLKQGLGDKDPEVVHYTASTLNYMEEKYEKAIQTARAACVENLTRKKLMNVAALYENYMSSGLLEDDILPIYRNSYIQVLELVLKEFGRDEEILELLIRAYLTNDQPYDAEIIMLEAVSIFPQSLIIRFAQMKYYYSLNSLEKLVSIAQTIRDIPFELTKEQKGIVDFWLQEENPA
jgi:amino acid transporter